MLKKVTALLASAAIFMSGITAMAQETSDLVGYWSFDRVEDGVVYDESGNGSNGIIENNAYQVTGYKGKALDFFAASQDVVRLKVGTVPTALTGAAGTTVSAWVKFPPVPSSGSQYIFNTPITGASGGLQVYLSGQKLRVAAKSTPNDTWNANVYTYPASNVWTHMAVVFDFAGDDVSLYLNGELQTPETAGSWNFADAYAPGTPTDADYIGGAKAIASRFDGVLDEFKLYRKALSAEEIKVDSGAAQDIDSDGLFLRYNMENSGTTVRDTSGKRLTGTLLNEAVYDQNGFEGKGISIPANSDATKANAISIPANGIGGFLNGKSAFTFSAQVMPLGTDTESFYRLLHITGSAKTSYVEAAFCHVNSVPGLRVVARSSTSSSWKWNFYPYDFVSENNGVWVNVTIVFDYENGKVRAYFDGVEQTASQENITAATLVSKTWVQGVSTLADYIGDTNNSTSASEPGLNGKLDNVYMYSRLLSDDEIMKLAKAEITASAEYSDGTAAVRIENNTPSNRRFSAIAATYKGGALSDVEIKDITAPLNTVRTIPMSLKAGEGETIRAFLWNDIETLEPFMK